MSTRIVFTGSRRSGKSQAMSDSLEAARSAGHTVRIIQAGPAAIERCFHVPSYTLHDASRFTDTVVQKAAIDAKKKPKPRPRPKPGSGY